MSREYSHKDPSPGRAGEWDTPARHRRDSSLAKSGWSTRSDSTRQSEQQQLTVAAPRAPLPRSQLRQEVLPEEAYIAHLSDIIQRDFFPHLRTLETQQNVLDAIDSQDLQRIHDSVQRMRSEGGRTPTVRRSRRADATPGRTPYAAFDSAPTPTHFDRTPMTNLSETPGPSSHRARPLPDEGPQVNANLGLDAFQARYTSQDNASFQELVVADNAARREKHAWAWHAEQKANVRAIKGREARERLVDVTRRMLESSGDGTVRLLDGPAGKPGERRLLVDEGVDIGSGPENRLLVTGRDEKERLLITNGEGPAVKSADVPISEREEVDERAQQFIDWDKATAEEKDDNKPIAEDELQVPTTAWPFKTRNSLMFPPDADRNNPSSLTGPPDAPTPANHDGSTKKKAADEKPILLGEPKGIRYHATRLREMETGRSSGGGSRRDSDAGSSIGSTSPSRSRIGAAIAGTPYPAPASQTPRVGGFSFVDALPSHDPSSLPAQALQELMTWGTIEATPTLRSSGGDASVGPFRVKETDRREVLAHKMARKAKRSLAESVSGAGRGLATTPGGSGAGSMRRTALEASIRSQRGGDSIRGLSGSMTPGGSGAATPRRSATDLSPAARSLLGKTKPGRALEGSLGQSRQWNDDEERRRVERAKLRAREVESRDRLRRERWTPSPAVSLGFDPDLPDPQP